MSFIQNRDRVFKSRSQVMQPKKLTTGRMKAASSFNDPRAWSMDPRDRTAFIFDVVGEMASSSGGEDNTAEVIPATKIGLEETVDLFKRSRLRKNGSWSAENIMDDSDHDLIKLNNKLFEAKEKIEELEKVNNNLKNEKNKTSSEVDNLRILVTNMKEHMAYLDDLRISRETSSSDNSDKDRALEDARMEIEHLSKEIEIYSEMSQCNTELRRAQNQLSEEKKVLSKTVHDLYAEKERLLKDLMKKEEDMITLETKIRTHDEQTVERIWLRDRLTAKDLTIHELESVIQSQTENVEDLKGQVVSMTECFKEKEGFLNQEIVDLKKTLREKCDMITQLETKLHETELLVEELEALRDQFRSTNVALTESIATNKQDVEKAIQASADLSRVIEKLQFENEAKDQEIQKLTLFPQNPDTMLYFSHLNKIVTSAGDINLLNRDQQVELMDNMKWVIVKLRTEMWGANITPLELQIQDSYCQTEANTEDSSTQSDQPLRSSTAQTALPDEYMNKCLESRVDISKLNSRLSFFEERLVEQSYELDSLETQLFDAIEDNHLKDLQLEKAEKNQSLLEETIKFLKFELDHTDQLLMEAVNEVDSQTESCKELKELMESTFQSTINEYAKYAKVLESYLEFKDNEIAELKIFSERDHSIFEETMRKSKCENDELRNSLETQVTANTEMNTEILHLTESLRDKICKNRELGDKLENAERMIRKFLEKAGLSDLKEECAGDYDHVDSLCSQLLVYKKDILEQLQNYGALEEEVEKLRRAKKFLKNVVVNHQQDKKAVVMKMKKINVCMRKLGKREKNYKEQVTVLEGVNGDLRSSMNEISIKNEILKDERTIILQEMFNLKNKLADLETVLSKYKDKHIMHEEMKMKMESMVLRLMKKVTKYKSALNDRKNLEDKFKNHVNMNEQLYHEIDMLKKENMSLSSTICGFEQKLSTLMELPEKESSSVELQVSLGGSKDEVQVKSVKSHYENIIASMKLDYDYAADQSRKQYVSNLKMLKDTYERDINILKKTHQESLSKMQLMHGEEIDYLTKRDRSDAWEKEKASAEMKFIEENANLRKGYENKLEDQKIKFAEEKSVLTKELDLVREGMTDLYYHARDEIEKIKCNFKSQIEKLIEVHRIERELIKRRHEKRLDFDIEQRINDRKRLKLEKEVQCSSEVSDSGTDPESSLNRIESSTNTEVISTTNVDIGTLLTCETNEETKNDTFRTLCMFPDKVFLLSRITELENSLQAQQTESARKIKLYEKRIKHEQMKAREIAHILDQELKYSTDVHCKLGLQYNRAEQLELEKETLSSRILLYEQQLSLVKKAKEDAERRPAPSLALTSGIDEGIMEAELQLEQSLTRLKQKLDQAVDHEARLMNEAAMMASSDGNIAICEDVDRVPRREDKISRKETGDTDMKVIVIKQHKITHAWTSQIDEIF